MDSPYKNRWEFHHEVNRGLTRIQKSPPPHNLTIHKGDVHVVLSRAFVEYILTDPVPLQLADYLTDVFCPEENFCSTLQYNWKLRAPGTLNCMYISNSYIGTGH